MLANVGVRMRTRSRYLGTVALDVVHALAAGLFDAGNDFAGGVALDLHVDFRVGQVADGLADDFHGLEHFEEADLGTGPAVAVEDGHGREPEFREGFVFRLAHVLSHAAAAQGRPRRRRAGWLPERSSRRCPPYAF